MTVLLADIGGLTSDFCVIGARGKLDNQSSTGLQEGVSPYLDTIMVRVQQETGHRFRNRQDLIARLTDPRPERRNHVSYKRVPISHMVDDVLGQLARVEFQSLRSMFNAADIDVAFIIGGGAVLLKPYLEAINSDKLPLRFIDKASQAVWMNAKGYFKLLEMATRKEAAVK